MRGIQISDSAPLRVGELNAGGKYDRKPKGDVKALPFLGNALFR